MDYAVIKISGQQYLVSEGQEIEVNNLPEKEGKKIDFSEVLLSVDEKKIALGKPVLKGAKVSVTVIKKYQGKKLYVEKFKAKTGYSRKRGFRPQLVTLRVDKITS